MGFAKSRTSTNSIFNDFQSQTGRYTYVDRIAFVDRFTTEVVIKACRVALMSNYVLSFHPKLQLLGSVEALVKKIDSKAPYTGTGTYPCHPTPDQPGILKQAVMVECFNTVKYSETNTRLQLGLGAQYQWADHISTRLMVNCVTSPYDFSRGKPYSWNTALQYHF